MTINPFIRDTAYFRVARDRGMMINAEDLDLQFSKLINFMNSKIVTEVNKMVADNIAGEVGTEGYYLLNVGDGSTKWSQITNSLINDNAISPYKLKNANAGSIVASNADRKFSEVLKGEQFQVLTSVAGDQPSWQLVREGNIANRSLSEPQIGYLAIGREHLAPGLRLDAGADLLGRNSIITPYIRDAAVTSEKLSDACLTQDKIDPAILAQRATYLATYGRAVINNYVIDNKHLADALVTGAFFRSAAENKGIIYAGSLMDGALTTAQIGDAMVEARAIRQINANNIAANTINGQWWAAGAMKLSERHLAANIRAALRA